MLFVFLFFFFCSANLDWNFTGNSVKWSWEKQKQKTNNHNHMGTLHLRTPVPLINTKMNPLPKEIHSTKKHSPVWTQDPTVSSSLSADSPPPSHVHHAWAAHRQRWATSNQQGKSKRHGTLSLRRALKILIFSMVDSMWLPLAVWPLTQGCLRASTAVMRFLGSRISSLRTRSCHQQLG